MTLSSKSKQMLQTTSSGFCEIVSHFLFRWCEQFKSKLSYKHGCFPHGKKEGISVLLLAVVIDRRFEFFIIILCNYFFLLFNQLFVHRRNLSKSKHFSSVSYYSARLNANYGKRVSEELGT